MGLANFSPKTTIKNTAKNTQASIIIKVIFFSLT
jgi:hypothetical protein